MEDNRNKSELEKVQEKSFKGIVLEAIEPITKKLSEKLMKLNIGTLRILVVLANLLIWWGANKFFSAGLTMIAGYGIFTVQMVLTVAVVFALFYLVSCPFLYLMTVLYKRAKQEKEQENTDIHRKSPLNTVGKVGRIICLVIGILVFVIGIISGFTTYGANSLVLLNLTGCCFWFGAEMFFGGLETAFKTIEELSQVEIKSETETTK